MSFRKASPASPKSSFRRLTTGRPTKEWNYARVFGRFKYIRENAECLGLSRAIILTDSQYLNECNRARGILEEERLEESSRPTRGEQRTLAGVSITKAQGKHTRRHCLEPGKVHARAQVRGQACKRRREEPAQEKRYRLPSGKSMSPQDGGPRSGNAVWRQTTNKCASGCTFIRWSARPTAGEIHYLFRSRKHIRAETRGVRDGKKIGVRYTAIIATAGVSMTTRATRSLKFSSAGEVSWGVSGAKPNPPSHERHLLGVCLVSISVGHHRDLGEQARIWRQL